MRSNNYILALDVGGTSLKSAIISDDGHCLRKTFRTVAINSAGSREEILNTLTGTLRKSLIDAQSKDLRIRAIGISMPGPFDYERGISLMKHKFASIYKLNLKKVIIKSLSLGSDISVIFKPDSWAFLVGEAWRGAARGYQRVIGITLGTGLGSAFMVRGHIVVEGAGIPPRGWLWNLPYKEGILEDWISRRGIIRRYKELTGEELDVKEIAFRSLHGDKKGLLVFRELGEILGKCLSQIALKFKPDCIVLGGQISKSFNLFKESMVKQLESVKSLKKVARAEHIDLAPLYGIAKMALDEIENKLHYPREMSNEVM